MERDEKWLEQERARLMTWPREQLIDWLQWVDSNGCWSDEDTLRNDMDPMDTEEAVEHVMNFIREEGPGNYLTPEEMITGSAEANPGRYRPGAFDRFGVKV